jgi:hypothetical protein
VLAGELPACFAPGTRAEGERCLRDAQCDSLYCDVSSGIGCGLCAARPEPEPDSGLAVGEACELEKFECRRDAYCGGPEANRTCIAFGRKGDSCGYDQMCWAGLFCSTEGQCFEAPLEGEECALAGIAPEQHLVCGKGLDCDTSTSPPSCQKVGLLGAPCRFTEQCAEGFTCGCPLGANCVTTTCLITRYGGESCADADSLCHDAFFCRAGECLPRDPADEDPNECGG